MAVRFRLGTFTEVTDDLLGREYVGWFPRMTEAEAWESGRGLHRIGADRIERERFALVVGGGKVAAIAEITGLIEFGGRAALTGELLAAGHAVYDAWIGQPDPIANSSRNPVAYETLPEEEPYLKRECYCGCGEFTNGADFMPGHDVRAMQDRVRLLFDGSPKDFLDWVDGELAHTTDPGRLERLAQLHWGRGRRQQAEATWIAAAQVGSLTAMNHLADLHAERDEPGEAEDWWRRAAAGGSSTAMLRLGVLHLRHGETESAETWWRQSADLGNTAAMVSLGDLFMDNGAVEAAMSVLRKAANLGSGPAMWRIGFQLRGKDRGEAETWFRKAIDHGDATAILMLAELLENRGELAEAAVWLRKLADRGDGAAMAHLAGLLEKTGEFLEAEDWASRAAQHGHPAVPALVEPFTGQISEHSTTEERPRHRRP